MCTPLSSGEERGIESLTKLLKVCVCVGRGGGFTGLQDLTFERGVAGKEGVTFFSGGLQFLQKKILKFEIFSDKKSL